MSFSFSFANQMAIFFKFLTSSKKWQRPILWNYVRMIASFECKLQCWLKLQAQTNEISAFNISKWTENLLFDGHSDSIKIAECYIFRFLIQKPTPNVNDFHWSVSFYRDHHRYLFCFEIALVECWPVFHTFCIAPSLFLCKCNNVVKYDHIHNESMILSVACISHTLVPYGLNMVCVFDTKCSLLLKHNQVQIHTNSVRSIAISQSWPFHW